MSTKVNQKILTAFENYRDAVWQVGADLHFWQSFLKFSVEEYRGNGSRPEEVYSAGFTAVNIDLTASPGFLKTHSKVMRIKTLDLDERSQDFFVWVMNLSILKIYNSLEVFLLQAIQMTFFPNHKNPIEGKKAVDEINKEIREYLKKQSINQDTKNNRHIIRFLEHKSSEVASFFKMPIRIDLITNWGNFFELISILRNVIAHQGTIINIDTLNDIKSKAKDVFQRHFILP
jgi:hypothetical protein